MQAIIMMLFAPVLPLACGLKYRKAKGTGEIILRYVIYTLILTLLSAVVLAITGAENVSFMEKLDMSPGFALKYVLFELILAGAVAAAEWIWVCRKVRLRADVEGYRNLLPVRLWKQYLGPEMIYILALFVVCLNVVLMFDNVLWGDEAFSANTAQNTMGGILQIMYYWDSHPPLYYFWLKLFGEIFGRTGVVYHLASIVPFAGGIVLAVTVLRKCFGKIPAAFFIIISGLGRACLQYNLEVRMYALAFLCVTVCYLSAYRVISTGKKSGWILMVFFGLAAAYTHYYALIACGMLIFFTGVAVWIRQRGKSWVKGFCAVLVYVIGYIPWLSFVFAAMERGAGNWWITEILGLSQCLEMIMGGNGMSQIVLPLIIVYLAAGLLVESGLFVIRKADGKCENGKDDSAVSCVSEDILEIQIHTPTAKVWSVRTYTMLVGAGAILGTLAAGYGVSVLFKPMLVARYLYPLSAVALIMLVIGSSQIIDWAKSLQEICQEQTQKTGCRVCRLVGMTAVPAVKGLLIVLLAVLLIKGIGIYRTESALMRDQKARTEAVLNLIGEPEEDVKMVATGVRHLTWTVLYYYFPDNEVVDGTFRDADADRFWYFTGNYMTQEEINEMTEAGYLISGYGDMQISQYPFVLYYFERESVNP